MRWTATVAALTFAAGCATSSGVNRTDAYDSATVSGVISLPDGTPLGDAACTGVTITAEGSSGSMGRAMVHQSRSRCSYEISRLPSGTDLSVTITAPAAWKCGNGASVAFAPRIVKLQDHETKTQDFQPLCHSS